MEVAQYAALLVLAYLMGSLPFGYWIGKLVKGPRFDIRDHGSCSIGATNVKRILGGWIAAPVLILDAAKGYLPTYLGIHASGPLLGGICLLAVMLGHAKSLYFFSTEGVFSGGKGVASALGGILALQPHIAGWSLGFFLLVLLIPWTRYVSLASMTASVFAFVLTFAYHLGLGWHIIFALVVVMIIRTHSRNIARLIAGIEPKFGQEPESDEVVSAFALHPLTMEDFNQTLLARWANSLMEKKILTERQVEWLIPRVPVLETGQITGIRTVGGKHGRVLILAIPLLPKMIQGKATKPILDALLKAAAVQAQRRGATVLTLGALLSSYANGGSNLQAWCKGRGLTITIDNGAAFTVAATLEAILKTLKEKNIKLHEATVAIVAARGLIGRRLGEEFEGKARKVITLARETDAGGNKMKIDLDPLGEADVVIFASSSQNPLLTRANQHMVKDGAVVVDVAVPPDVASDVELEVIRSGLILLPGKPQIGMDFHFGEKDGVTLVPACLAQSWILAATRQFQRASRGARIRHEDVAFLGESACEMGFEVVVSDLSEPEIFGKG